MPPHSSPPLKNRSTSTDPGSNFHINQALDDLDHVPRMECLRFLCKICAHQALLPKPLDIAVSYVRTEIPPRSGGFSDVWKGTSLDREVAIKVLKVYRSSDHEQIRRVSF
jgi:hypothetical protein